MNEYLTWPLIGCRGAAVIPLELDSATNKYKLPTTLKIYMYDTIGDGSGAKSPAPADSNSKDTFLSFETTSAQTIQCQIYPTTLTLKSTGFKVESGESAEQVYPEVTLVAGNTPLLKSGAGTAARISVKENIQWQLAMQKVPCIVAFDLGVEVGSDSIGAGYVIGKFGDASYYPKGKSYEGDTLTFTGKSVSTDIASLEAITITPLEQAAITLPALTAAEITKIAGGELLIK